MSTESSITIYRHQATQTDGLDELADLMVSMYHSYTLFEKLTQRLNNQLNGPSADATRKFNSE